MPHSPNNYRGSHRDGSFNFVEGNPSPRSSSTRIGLSSNRVSMSPQANGQRWGDSPLPIGSGTSLENDAMQTIRVQQHEDAYALQIMHQRQEELQDINRKMHVVNEIYKDLGEVVEQQQEDIDVVEQQIGDASDHAKKGLEQLECANNSKCTSVTKSSTENKSEEDLQRQGSFSGLASRVVEDVTAMGSDIAAKIGEMGKIASMCGAGSALTAVTAAGVCA